MINFDATLKTLTGEDMQIPGPNGATKPASLRVMAAMALCGTYQDEQNLAGDEKFRRGMLAMKLENGGAEQLKAEEIAEIKKLIGKAYGPWEVAQAWRLLDPAE